MEKPRCALDPYDENADYCPIIPPSELKEEDINKIQLELRDTKSKLRTITQKFSALRKERDTLKKDNKDLQNEVMLLQNSMREMIPGFSNTGSVYPMYNELQVMISDFFKCSCEDVFFDVLSPELTMEGVVYFFREVIEAVQKTVTSYFEPTYQVVKKSTCTEKLEGPLMNVMKKVYQNSWKKVLAACVPCHFGDTVAAKVQEKLQLGGNSASTNKTIAEFAKKLSEILFLCAISEPELVLETEAMGTKILFNTLKHESMDGFVKHKEMVVVVLPAVHKSSLSGEIIGKARVLPVNYEFS